MLEIFINAFPMAAGVATSPVPIVITLVLLMTARARTNGPAFMIGWVIGIISVSCLVLLLPGLKIDRGGPTTTEGFVKLGLGCFLLLLAIKQWYRRNLKADNTITNSPLMARLDKVGAWQCLAIGFLILVLNMKNMPLTAAGAHMIAVSPLNQTGQFMLLIPYIGLASSSVVIPVIIYFLLRERADQIFDTWKGWLIRNNAKVLLVLLLLFGTALSYGGIVVLGSVS